MANVCDPCGEKVKRNEKGIPCDGDCGRWFHKDCVGISDESYAAFSADNSKKWFCRRKDCKPPNPTRADILVMVVEEVNKLMLKHRNELAEHKKEIEGLKLELEECKNACQHISNQYDDLTKSIPVQNSESKQNSEVQGEVQDIQQYQRRNNLVITGLPEEKEEDLYLKVQKMSEALGVRMSAADIDTVHRKDKTRAKPVLVKLINRWKKDELTEARFAKKKLELDELELGYKNGKSQIFLNDHLIPRLDSLAKRCRDLRRDKKIWATWSRDCKIYVKCKKEDINAKLVRSEEDLRKLNLN